ncbi:bacteriophage abortive infection AbiH family protein [Vibrio sp. WJH972]
MRLNHLFIIGNGFDLWHKIPTSYQDFYKQHSGYLDQIEHYFSSGLQKEDLWSDFENVLGQFDVSILIAENNFIDFSGDDFPTKQMYGLEDAVENFSHDTVQYITSSFTEWINGINLTSSGQKITFPEATQFISFNYTSTLQQIYEIPEENVYHIHGSVRQTNSLIFGHSEEVIYPNAEEASYETVAINNGLQILEAFQKPVNDIVRSELNPWLTNYNDISVITVIGHSLNKIDLPYFSSIVNQFPDAIWQCYSYTPTEAIKHRSILEGIGVPTNNLSVGIYEKLVQQYPL